MNKNIVLQEDEQLDDLQLNGLMLIQNKNLYCFTSDAVILANFIKTKHTDIYVDFCAGNGIIPILVNEKQHPIKTYGIEIQSCMACLFEKNIKLNEVEDKIFVIHDRVQNVKNYFEAESVDVVSCNPPYVKENNLAQNSSECVTIARHEVELNLQEMARSASTILKHGGKFYLVHLAERLTEIITTLIDYKLMPKKIFFTHSLDNKNAKLVVLEAVKNGKSGVTILPPLITNNLDGSYKHNNFR